jgi:hypothetical protein
MIIRVLVFNIGDYERSALSLHRPRCEG